MLQIHELATQCFELLQISYEAVLALVDIFRACGSLCGGRNTLRMFKPL